MENLSPAELRRTLSWVIELAECPVCHETLTPKVVLCVRGHPVCVTCHKGLRKSECPLCRGAFSNVQPTGFIHQVIDALPHPCRHKDCDYFVMTKDDHEKYCTYKHTKCRYCDWSGAAKEIVNHLQSSHTTEASKYLSLLGSTENGVPFDPKEECSVFTPIIVDGHFFWGEMKNEPRAGKLTAVFHPVLNGKTKTVFKASVKLEGSYSADIKLNMDPDVDPDMENCILIHTSVLHKSTVENKLQYRIMVNLSMFDSFTTVCYNTVQLGTTKVVEFLNNQNFNIFQLHKQSQ